MKFIPATSFILSLFLPIRTTAFSPLVQLEHHLILPRPLALQFHPQSHSRWAARSTTTTTTRRWAEESSSSSAAAEDRVAALRAAAAKAREDAERLRRELGQPSETATTASAVSTKLSTDEVKQLVQAQDWSTLAKSSAVFGSANVRTFAVSLAMLEQRTGLTARSLGLDDGTGAQGGADLDDLKWATVIVALGSAVLGVAALAWLPPNIGATACYLIALIPVLFLGIGSTAPGLILNVIGSIKGGGGDQGDAGRSVSQRERRVRHEAAHLCCGYWCGLPVQSYSVDENGAQVEFGNTSPPPYSPTQVAALAVTGLAGLVAEALQWSNAQGATQDLLLVDSIFRKGQDFYGAAAQQDLTRWAAFTAAQLLRQYAAKYERVVQAMSNQAPLAECVAILEEE